MGLLPPADSRTGALLVDAGNTAVKWVRLGAAGDLVAPGYAAYGEASLERVLDGAWGGWAPPPSVWLASVADRAVARTIAAWCRQAWGLVVRSVSAEATGFGVSNGYAEPAQLGVDRWLAILGARARCAGAFCVTDCGTAATVDAVAAGGRHLGGFIVPGIELSRRALLEFTRIPRIGASGSAEEFGTDTAAAVALGSRRALAGVVHFVLRRLAAAGEAPQLFLTGSEATAVRALVDGPVTEAPHLVLEGLARYAKRG
ncbi:MAG: type III pantothenate kinase [Gammaproteobacteria bacterium]